MTQNKSTQSQYQYTMALHLASTILFESPFLKLVSFLNVLPSKGQKKCKEVNERQICTSVDGRAGIKSCYLKMVTGSYRLKEGTLKPLIKKIGQKVTEC